MFIQAQFTTVKDYSLYAHQIMNSLLKTFRDIIEESRENHQTFRYYLNKISYYYVVEVTKSSRD